MIPKKSIKDDLIIISRKELGRLLTFAKKEGKTVNKSLQFLALEAKARKNLTGPFSTTKKLFKSLDI